ncbi:MAG: LysR family transcriptional regulator [Oscillospiraceae bacterium]|nr:LysR family transcriptional regulator [Oscillospiraceae bacterium]
MDSGMLKYRAFLKTVELGSFTRAAEALHYSQSGVSRMIAELEHEWRVTLLTRGRGGVALTAEGTRLLPRIRALCAADAALAADVDALHGLESGLIRVAAFSSVAAQWLPGVIRAFREDYPGIDYELLTGVNSEIEQWLLSGRADCGFLCQPVTPALQTRVLGADPLLAVLPEGHPLAALPRVPLAALAAEPFMLLDDGGPELVSRLFAEAGLAPRVQFTSSDDFAIMSMVENGLGVSILPELILRRVPYRVALRPVEDGAQRTICLALREGEPPVAVERFLGYVDRLFPS